MDASTRWLSLAWRLCLSLPQSLCWVFAQFASLHWARAPRVSMDRRGPRTTAPGETTLSEGCRGYNCRIWWHRHHLLCIPYMPPFVSPNALKTTTPWSYTCASTNRPPTHALTLVHGSRVAHKLAFDDALRHSRAHRHSELLLQRVVAHVMQSI